MFIALLFASSLAASQQTGSIAGCIVDAMRQPLPGVTVAATGESVRGTTETNTLGCYNLKGLAPGTYRLTVRLAGFGNVTRDKVAVTPAAPASVDLTMQVSPLCDCPLVTRTLAEHVAAAAAVLHVRITGPQGGQPEGAWYYQHAAAVLHTIKAASELPSTIALQQDQSNGMPLPYDVDVEMVALLEPSQGAYRIVNANPSVGNSGTMVFLVRDGRIVQAPAEFSRYVGMTLDSFMYELRTAAAAR